ncbi:MAG: zinc-binding dehydrogenase [Spirochaetaceae bacterium]
MGLKVGARSLYLTEPGVIDVREERIPSAAAEAVLVSVLASAVSPGTELLAYRGKLPAADAAEAAIDPYAASPGYPMRLGYAAVGRVSEVGETVDPSWRGRMVFAFRPHGSHFVARPEELLPLPEHMSPETATFIANLETAVGLVMDGAPLAGERVCVIGLGVVGLLTTALLSRFPLKRLTAFDPLARRREMARALGAEEALDPFREAPRRTVESGADSEGLGAPAHGVGDAGTPAGDGADLIYEVSGNPDALDTAIELAGYGGRIVVGSWYGSKRASVDLGGRFHRRRIKLIGSQVSTIAPEYRGRWDKARRLRWVREMAGALGPQRLITHRFPIEKAAEAYRVLDTQPEAALGVLLSYDDYVRRG